MSRRLPAWEKPARRSPIFAGWVLALVVSATFFASTSFAGVYASNSSLAPTADEEWPDLTGTTWPTTAIRAPEEPSGTSSSLVLYDDLGEYAPASQVYGTMATALASHFGTPTMRGVSTYEAGDMEGYSGVVYVGVSNKMTLPPSFVADVLRGGTRVLWLGANLDELAASDDMAAPTVDLTERYGWTWVRSEERQVRRVEYKNTSLSENPDDADSLARVFITDTERAQVLATTVFRDGSRAPWAVRSGNLTYVTETALDAAELSGHRYLAVCDLFIDLLQPDAPTRHRALVRLEDISPTSDPEELRRVADMLHQARVPFSFALYPVSVDGLDADPRRTLTLSDRPAVVHAVAHMLQRGGTMILHGYSHNLGDLRNPDTGGSGADFEFFLVHRENDGTLVYDGPVPGDSKAWATERLSAAVDEITKTGLPAPRIMEFPHYAASAADYEAAGPMFDARYDRPQYLSTAWRTGPMSPYLFAQYAPYVVRDGYGSTVIPENLGFIEGPPVPADGVGSLRAIVEGARQNLVVRDGVASFFYHPYLGTEGLSWIVRQMTTMGYEFVSPGEL